MRGKAKVLGSIRAALADVPQDETPEAVVVTRDYAMRDNLSAAERTALFEERVADYKVTVKRIREPDLSAQVGATCRARNVVRLVIPPGIPQAWLPEGLDLLPGDTASHAELDSSDGVLTACALAIAQTGTIALDGGSGQGRRALTLLPDYHLCVVFEHQIVGLVPEALVKLESSVKAGRPITFISGPSATSDIELSRVEGVHGPRTLDVLLVTSTPLKEAL